ncbi:hypothetical protein [Planctomycetes bacterium Pan216]
MSLLAVGGCGKQTQPAPRNTDVDPPSTFPLSQPQQEAPALARLNFRWGDATSELIAIVQRLPPEDRLAVGLGALATGVDIYGARVQLTNTGNVPLRIFPQNILIHFGGETTEVYTFPHQLFLRPTILQPNDQVEGVVAYSARMDIGAAIRLGSGEMSYRDPTILVTYD